MKGATTRGAMCVCGGGGREGSEGNLTDRQRKREGKRERVAERRSSPDRRAPASNASGRRGRRSSCPRTPRTPPPSRERRAACTPAATPRSRPTSRSPPPAGTWRCEPWPWPSWSSVPSRRPRGSPPPCTWAPLSNRGCCFGRVGRKEGEGEEESTRKLCIGGAVEEYCKRETGKRRTLGGGGGRRYFVGLLRAPSKTLGSLTGYPGARAGSWCRATVSLPVKLSLSLGSVVKAMGAQTSWGAFSAEAIEANQILEKQQE